MSGTTAVPMTRGATAHVVLLPGGVVGDALLERVRVWTGEGLLDPVFWVPASSVLEHPTMPASIQAFVYGRTLDGEITSREVPLLATLGLNKVSDLVVTCVRWLVPGQTDRHEVASSSQRLLEAMKSAMPLTRQVEEVKVEGTRVRSLNVIFAATRTSSDELAELLSTDWQENILVSPEDRPRPDSADRFTDASDTDTWASFVAASVATLAGLWCGYSGQMIRRSPGSGLASNIAQVRVARTFARGVLSGDFAVDLARDAAAALAQPASPLLDSGVAGHALGMTAMDGDEAERQVGRAAEFVLAADSGQLTYRGLEALPQPDALKVPWGRAIGSFISFSFDKVTSIPTWITEWFAERASEKTQQALMGESSDALVDARGDLGLGTMDVDILDVASAIKDLQQQVHTALGQPPIPVTRIAVPTLWAALRGTIFTLIDGGSELDGMGPILIDGKVAVVANTGMVIPAPWDTWTLPASAAKHLTGREDTETVASWTELAAARELLAHLTERAQDLELRHRELRERYAKSHTILFATERDYVEAREEWEDTQAAREDAEVERSALQPAPSAAPMVDSSVIAAEVPDTGVDLVSVRAEEPEPAAVAEPTLLDQQAERQFLNVGHQERVVAIRRERTAANRAKAEKARADAEALAAARDSLATWLQDRSSSLALRLIDHLDRQESILANDEQRVAEWARAPIPDLSGSARQLRRAFVRSLWVWLAVAFALPILLFALSKLMDSRGITLFWLESTTWKYVLLGVVLMLIGTLLALLAYHRGFTNLRGELGRRMETGRFLLGSIDFLRRERARIDGISPQLRDRLSFYGAVIQEPYRIPGYRAGAGEESRIAEHLPALLQLASADAGQSELKNGFRARVVGKNIKVGMRRRDVESLLAAAAAAGGIPADQADLRSVDSEASATSARHALLKLVRDESVLEEVGRRRVREIAANMQRDLTEPDEVHKMPDELARPLIHRINIDGLQGMQVKQDLLAQWEREGHDWDAFASEILQNGPALSNMAFSSQGLVESKHLKFDSIACVPPRVRGRAGPLVSIVDLEVETIRSAEIVARLDITPPMDVKNVALFSEAVMTQSRDFGIPSAPEGWPSDPVLD